MEGHFLDIVCDLESNSASEFFDDVDLFDSNLAVDIGFHHHSPTSLSPLLCASFEDTSSPISSTPWTPSEFCNLSLPSPVISLSSSPCVTSPFDSSSNVSSSSPSMGEWSSHNGIDVSPLHDMHQANSFIESNFSPSTSSPSCPSSPFNLYSSDSLSASPASSQFSDSPYSSPPLPTSSLSSSSESATTTTGTCSNTLLSRIKNKNAAVAVADASGTPATKKRTRKRRRVERDFHPTAVTLSREVLLKMTNDDLDKYEAEIRKTRELTLDEAADIKRQRRLIKNRESAQLSRVRKREQSDEMEKVISELVQDNDALKERVSELEKENQTLRSQLSKANSVATTMANASPSGVLMAAKNLINILNNATTVNTRRSNVSASATSGIYLMIVLFAFGMFFDLNVVGIPFRSEVPFAGRVISAASSNSLPEQLVPLSNARVAAATAAATATATAKQQQFGSSAPLPPLPSAAAMLRGSVAGPVHVSGVAPTKRSHPSEGIVAGSRRLLEIDSLDQDSGQSVVSNYSMLKRRDLSFPHNSLPEYPSYSGDAIVHTSQNSTFLVCTRGRSSPLDGASDSNTALDSDIDEPIIVALRTPPTQRDTEAIERSMPCRLFVDPLPRVYANRNIQTVESLSDQRIQSLMVAA